MGHEDDRTIVSAKEGAVSITPEFAREKIEGAILLWCDPEDVDPLTREYLVREILRGLFRRDRKTS